MTNLTINELVKGGALANGAIDLGSLKYTSRLIVEQLLARGWKVAHFVSAPSILFIQIPGRSELVRVFSASPSTTSYVASKIAKNKSLTSSLLVSAGLPVIPEMMYHKSKIVANKEEIEMFLNEHRAVVVKPLDASHGYGVRTNLTAIDDVIEAAQRAVDHSQLKRVLIQKQYDGHDVRILCINYKFVNSITRLPARVFGDGKSTIEALILAENQSPIRGENYKAKLNIIDIEKARQYLGSKGIKRVPIKGEEVPVVGISNVGAGGERVNIAGQIPGWMKQKAEAAAEILQLPVCGVDFLVRSLPRLDSIEQQLEPVILEVNECPMMTMYDDLDSPQQQAVIDTFLDYLQTIPESTQ